MTSAKVKLCSAVGNTVLGEIYIKVNLDFKKIWRALGVHS